MTTLSKQQFNQICDDLEAKLSGISYNPKRRYDDPFTRHRDYILSVPSWLLADSIWDAYFPLCISHQSKYGLVIAEFRIKNADIDEHHPLLTPEGREKAYNRLPDVIESRITEAMTFGDTLATVSSAVPMDQHEIETLIRSKMDEIKNNFKETEGYDGKNAVLLEMDKLYDLVQDATKLEAFLDENVRFSPSMS